MFRAWNLMFVCLLVKAFFWSVKSPWASAGSDCKRVSESAAFQCILVDLFEGKASGNQVFFSNEIIWNDDMNGYRIVLFNMNGNMGDSCGFSLQPIHRVLNFLRSTDAEGRIVTQGAVSRDDGRNVTWGSFLDPPQKAHAGNRRLQNKGDAKMEVPKNGWFIMEDPLYMDDWGGTDIFGNLHLAFGARKCHFETWWNSWYRVNGLFFCNQCW